MNYPGFVDAPLSMRVAELESLARCDCTCADQCFLGKVGMQSRCTYKELCQAKDGEIARLRLQLKSAREARRFTEEDERTIIELIKRNRRIADYIKGREPGELHPR
jgi:hypothetical protein